MRRRADAPTWVFYEGPPTANGRPGSHHVLARVFKDIYPRYRTMCGYRVPRKAGWDCHGLPVELEVEKELGLDPRVFRLVCIPSDVHFRLGEAEGWGKQPCWTHFDGYLIRPGEGR